MTRLGRKVISPRLLRTSPYDTVKGPGDRGQDGAADVVLRADGRYNQPVSRRPYGSLDEEREADATLYGMRGSEHKGIGGHNNGGKVTIKMKIVERLQLSCPVINVDVLQEGVGLCLEKKKGSYEIDRILIYDCRNGQGNVKPTSFPGANVDVRAPSKVLVPRL